jgi:hypothetical protein
VVLLHVVAWWPAILVVGGVTILIASLVLLLQSQIKKVLSVGVLSSTEVLQRYCRSFHRGACLAISHGCHDVLLLLLVVM